MANPVWLDQVRDAAERLGLPPEYTERLLEELDDHAEELDDAGEPHDRLGDALTIAGEAAAGYRSGRFSGRHPLFAFVLGPIFVFMFVWSLYTAFGDIVLGTFLIVAGEPGLAWGMGTVAFLEGFLVPAVTFAAIESYHRGSGRPRSWFYGGCLVVVCLAPFLVLEFGPATSSSPPSVFVKLELRRNGTELSAQMLSFLAIGAAVAFRSRRARALPITV